MMHSTLRRWHRTLTGFPGLGGIGWLASVMRAADTPVEENLEPAEIAGPETRYLTIAGEPVAIREMGAGDPAIILLHGFGGRIETWRDVQPALARHHRTVALDLWGFGASGRPAHLVQHDWVMETFGVMDALGIERAVFVSHSLGGRVSLLCARQSPRRVLGLALCDADWGQAPHGYLLARAICASPMFSEAMRRLRGEPAHIQRLMSMVLGRNFTLTPELVSLFQQPLRVRGTTQALGSVGRANRLRDVKALTRDIARPALVIWGADDPVIPAGYAPLLARRLHAEGPLLVPDCGHFPQEEYPEVVTTAIREWVARRVAAGTLLGTN
jgi:pyruvate dehydrogenase E2 component (dihydrolipoamide acetyltransferase)